MTPRSTSWWPRLVHTPVRDALRGRLTAALNWRQQLRDAQLPEPCERLVETVILKTRLWRREKCDLVQELTAHFQDGIEAGNRAEQLIDSFGPPNRVARLIRRAKRRNRPWHWQVGHRFRQTLGGVALVYLVLVVLALFRHPAPNVNYLTELNRASIAAAEADRAWPLYRPILLDYQARDLDSGNVEARPGEPGWEEAKALILENAAMLQALREAAASPAFGLQLGFGWDLSKEDSEALIGPDWKIPSAPGPELSERLEAESLAGVLLPHLVKLKVLALWLAADMVVAAEEGDGPRFVADREAALGISRHVREHSFLINQLVSIALVTSSNVELARTLNRYPKFLSNPELIELAHSLATASELLTIDLKSEGTGFLDFIQRLYTDNGNGDGRISREGLRFLSSFGFFDEVAFDLFPDRPPLMGGAVSGGTWLTTAATPLVAYTVATRSEILREFDHLLSLTEADAARPLWAQLSKPSQSALAYEAFMTSRFERWHYFPLTLFNPDMAKAGIKSEETRMFNDALMVAIGLELYHRENDAYPESLDKLSPRWIPEIPLDASTGKPLLFRVRDGRPIIYGRGRNGIDNGGTQTVAAAKAWPKLAKDSDDGGDWVLFPPPAREANR